MDKLVAKIVALGIPGLILLLAVSISGYAGAAAITTALAAFGGPFGMLGGIGAFALAALILNGISEYGFEKIFTNVLLELEKKGHSRDQILRKIEKYPISRSLKLKLKDKFNQYINI
ncbi:MAG: hypothetical protein ACOCP8_06795 [archaeon]